MIVFNCKFTLQSAMDYLIDDVVRVIPAGDLPKFALKRLLVADQVAGVGVPLIGSLIVLGAERTAEFLLTT